MYIVESNEESDLQVGGLVRVGYVVATTLGSEEKKGVGVADYLFRNDPITKPIGESSAWKAGDKQGRV